MRHILIYVTGPSDLTATSSFMVAKWLFVVVMRCIANKIKMSFYIDKESVFLMLKITFL